MVVMDIIIIIIIYHLYAGHLQTYTCKKKTVFRAVLWLLCMVHLLLFPMFNVLYLYNSTYQSMHAVPNGLFFVVA